MNTKEEIRHTILKAKVSACIKLFDHCITNPPMITLEDRYSVPADKDYCLRQFKHSLAELETEEHSASGASFK